MGNTIFYNRLETLRLHKNLGWKQLAQLLDISVSHIMMIKSGKRQPSQKLEQRLAAEISALGGEFSRLTPGPLAAPSESNAHLDPFPELKLQLVPVISWSKAGAFLDGFGESAAGNFGDLEHQINEKIASEARDPNAYAVIIEGDSMEPRFCAGDRIIAGPAYEPRNGDFVIARLRETGLVLFKRFRRTGPEGKIIRLESLNPDYPALEYPLEAFRLIHPMIDGKFGNVNVRR